MIALHPPLSGAPLTTLMLLLVIELCIRSARMRSWSISIRPFIVASCAISVVLAFISGYQASSMAGDLVPHVAGAMARHHALGRLLLVVAGLLATFFFLAQYAQRGSRLLMSLYYVTLLCHIVLTIQVGQHGGDLVFEHGVGVRSKTSGASHLSNISE